MKQKSIQLIVASVLCLVASEVPVPSPVHSQQPTWSPNVRINDDLGTVCQDFPAISIDRQGNAYAVWEDTRNGDRDVYFAYRSAEGGWEANARVNDDVSTTRQLIPSIAVDSVGNAYAFWEDSCDYAYAIYYSYKPAGGNWGPKERLDKDVEPPYQVGPNIALDEAGNAYALWMDYRNGDWRNGDYNPDTYFSYRPAGSDWGDSVRVNDDTGKSRQWGPDLAVDRVGNAYALWLDKRSGRWDAYFAYRPAGGNWEPNVRVNDVQGSVFPMALAIAVDQMGRAYAVWTDERNGDLDVYFAYRPAGGEWGGNTRVSDDSAIASESSPDIAVDSSGNAYAVWEDTRNGDFDIYFAHRPGGGDWGTNERVNDDLGTALQVRPAITTDLWGNAYTVWVDGRIGDDDIYFSYRTGPSPKFFLPIAYEGRARGTNEGFNTAFGGFITAAFDHDPEPDQHRPFSGKTYTRADCPSDPPVFGVMCYDGHNGIDFDDPTDNRAFAVATGTVTYVGDTGSGYGKMVEIQHGNTGYTTSYCHLERWLVSEGQQVDHTTPVGVIGETGCPDCGTHLHFMAKYNGTPVDPTGWWHRTDSDPWEEHTGIAPHYLWAYPINISESVDPAEEETLVSPSGHITVEVPADVYEEPIEVVFTCIPVAGPSTELCNTGHSFSLEAFDSQDNPITTLNEPLVITIHYTDEDIVKVREDTLALYRWEDSASAWQSIDTTIDPANNVVTAQAIHLSEFVLFGRKEYRLFFPLILKDS
jgi:murein DD-endopeptidase MepM/ murein hydrolase activator NlpD